MPPNNIYCGSRELMVGEEVGQFATTTPPLPEHQYFTSKCDGEHWLYIENPCMGKNPLDKVLTYADCRILEYPKIEDYVDGVVKNDEEQIAAYVEACQQVKSKWLKTMEPITLREYCRQKLNLP